MDQTIQNQLNQVLERAYGPYSGVKVAAAIEYDVDGETHISYGVNVENVSYGLTTCAERNAISSAIANGMGKLKAVHLISNQAEPLTPCGACRQVIAEFAENAEVEIHSRDKAGKKTWQSTVAKMLPSAFDLDNQ